MPSLPPLCAFYFVPLFSLTNRDCGNHSGRFLSLSCHGSLSLLRSQCVSTFTRSHGLDAVLLERGVISLRFVVYQRVIETPVLNIYVKF